LALYEGLKSGGSYRPEPERPPRRAPQPARADAWRVAEARTRGGQDDAPWMDRLLGRGATQTLGRAAGSAAASWQQRRARPDEAVQPAMRARHMQAVGAGDGPVPQGRKGLIRGVLLALALVWAVLLIRPWQRMGALKVDVSSLFTRAEAVDQAQQAAEKRRAEAAVAQADAQRLAGLPLVPGTGKPLALWQDGSLRWYKVDASGDLAPAASPWARDCLGLPELRGLSARAEEHGGGRRLRLELPAGLLPLDPAVSSEARALLLEDPAQPVLLTHDGTRCLLGPDHWEQRQQRLALVLADLAARKRRAGTIDLRYEDTAVVRPAGRS